jgi:hypothetical protein
MDGFKGNFFSQTDQTRRHSGDGPLLRMGGSLTVDSDVSREIETDSERNINIRLDRDCRRDTPQA